MKNDETIKNIAIIGLGLMGGSLALAIKKHTVHIVFGYDRDKNTLCTAQKAGAIDFVLDEKNIEKIDILIIALMPNITMQELDNYAPQLKHGTIIFDICGVKKDVAVKMEALSKKYPHLEFISSHPMAGREVSGFKAAKATLFGGASMLLVNISAKDNSQNFLQNLFNKIGFSKVLYTTAEEHDKIIAYTSQACHAISAAFCLNSLADKHFGFSAGSFSDLTRVAKLDPKMWTELFLLNSENLNRTLEEFISEITAVKDLILGKDSEGLENYLTKAVKKRDAL